MTEPVKLEQKMYLYGQSIIVQNFMPVSECNALMQYMERFGNFEGSRTGGAGIDLEKIKNPKERERREKESKNSNIRQCEVAWIESTGNPQDFTTNVTNMCHNHMTSLAQSSFGCDVHRIEPLQYTKYTFDEDNEVKDHYDWHMDSYLHSRPTPFDRKVSMSLQVSPPDDYDGCGLEFQTHQILCDILGNEVASDKETIYDMMKQQGTAVFFPSICSHRVTPITRGKRIALVGWLQGPRWR